ncbi:hypothetical protein HJG54_31365 [Leptolyngbya sp. NK1-12]|uniref:Uncharacterized protein n=1 Tax=Leptolyngbya sp. NK1-12 TaxID=2547451 RepID=A0AA96WLQ8_9CYAN|nr:hypothetical protein [Leptolyngbya sp. NK1-12]WNZ27385.1 hypothetical protein HJG54_31365 [Leptolyngbya sp. NK1-12]
MRLVSLAERGEMGEMGEMRFVSLAERGEMGEMGEMRLVSLAERGEMGEGWNWLLTSWLLTSGSRRLTLWEAWLLQKSKEVLAAPDR